MIKNLLSQTFWRIYKFFNRLLFTRFVWWENMDLCLFHRKMFHDIIWKIYFYVVHDDCLIFAENFRESCQILFFTGGGHYWCFNIMSVFHLPYLTQKIYQKLYQITYLNLHQWKTTLINLKITLKMNYWRRFVFSGQIACY